MNNPILWLIIDNAVKLFEILLIFIFFNAFFEKKYKNRIIDFALITLFFIFISILNTFKAAPQFNLLFSFLFSLLIFSIFYRGTFLKKLLVLIIFNAIYAISEIVIIFLIYSGFQVSLEQAKNYDFYRLIAMFFTKIGLFIIIKFLIRFIKKTNAQKIPLNYWLLLMIVPIVTSVAMFSGVTLINKLDVSVVNPYVISISFVGLLFTNIIVFYLFESILASEEIKYSLNAVQAQMELQAKYYNEIEENQNETRRIWHDMKHHINYIGLMLKDNNTHAAKDYLVNLESTTDSLIMPINSGNKIIDAILSQKYANAKRKNIEIKFDIHLLEEVNIETQDLCVILSNALDNAIEACEKITDERIKKEIGIFVGSERSFLKVRVINPIVSQPIMKNNELITTKLDEKNHGIGLKSIKKITEKYNGAMTIKTDENGFDLLLLLNLKK
jgi:hypothetical protein